MATSGTTTYSTNAGMLIQGALRILGVVSQGDNPNVVQIQEAMESLNFMVKAYEADGMPLWKITQTTIPLAANVGAYTLGPSVVASPSSIVNPKPLKVIQGFLHNIQGLNDTPMRIVTRQEYNMLGNKTTLGTPIQLFYEPLLDTGVLHVYPVPASSDATANNIVIVYQSPFEDFDATTDEPDFPQEWYDAVKFGLADRLSAEYGIEMQHRSDIQKRAIMYKQEALSFGTEEGSLYFQTDVRHW
jgi:hypothetical protein